MTVESFKTINDHVSKKEIRQFSIEHSREERVKTARDIKKERSEYFERKKKYGERISDVKQRIEKKSIEADVIINEIKNLENILKEKQSTLLKSLFNILKIQLIRKQLGVKEQHLKNIQREQKVAEHLLKDFTYMGRDRGELHTAKKMLSAFYEEQLKKPELKEAKKRQQLELLKQYEKEERARDVSNAIVENGVFFIHSTDNSWRQDNSDLSRELSAKDKIKIVLGFEPTVCASTIRPGDTSRNAWGPFGVLLRGGTIESASQMDAGTVSRDRTKGVKERPSPDEIKKSINERIGSYNEFSIANPEVAGLFVFADALDVIDRSRQTAWSSDVARTAQEFNLPIFIIENGKLFQAHSEKIQQKHPVLDRMEEIIILVREKEISHEEASQLQSPVAQEKKQGLRKEILTNSPFKSGSPLENAA